MAKVFIGVGHGGADSGSVGYLVEKEVNLVEALACRDFLEARGVEVLMPRSADENDPVTDKINECNAFEPDLAIDVHSNEGFFVDNETDIKIADTIEKQRIFGTAYAKGILRTLEISIKENSSQPESDKKAKYYVQVGAYSSKENAEKQLQKAEDAGFSDAFIKEN